jgi:hypothetical protein
MPPSESAKSSAYTKSQLSYSIHDGRYKENKPRTSIAPPIQLFHSVFGHFLDDVKDANPIPDDTIRKTTEYMKAASAIYPGEEKRRIVLTPILCEIFGVDIKTIVNNDKTNADGVVELLLEAGRLIILLQEDKNEFGEGGSDPATQAGLSTARSWAQTKVYDFYHSLLLVFFHSCIHSLVQKASKCHQLPYISHSHRWSMDCYSWCCLHRRFDCPASDRLHLGRIRLCSK